MKSPGIAALALVLAVTSCHAAPPSSLDERVSVRVRSAPLATYLDALSAQAKINFIVTDGLEGVKITSSLHDVTVRQALDNLVETNGLRYRRLSQSETYLIESKERAAAGTRFECADFPKAKVTVRVKNATLAVFLETLSSQAKASFSLAQGLEEKRVTVFFKNVTAAEALEIILDAKGLSCRKSAKTGTYLIGP